MIVKLSTVPTQAAEVIRALRSLKLAIQSVHGLVCSHIYTDAETPDSLMYVEEWRTPADLAQVAVAAHFKRLFALMERSTQAPILRVASLSDACGIEHLSTLMKSPTAAGRPDARLQAPTVPPSDGGSP